MPRLVEPAEPPPKSPTPTAFAHPGQQTVKAAGFESLYMLAEASMQVVQPRVLEAAALSRVCGAHRYGVAEAEAYYLLLTTEY